MAYKVLDLFKDLPGTNCGDCGKSGCFAFATSAYLEGTPLEGCPHLPEPKRREMAEKIEASRAGGGGKKQPSHVQALNFLLGKVAQADFAAMASATGAALLPGPPEALEIPFLGIPHRLTAADVAAASGEPPTVWVKVFLYIYATRANGNPPSGRWVAFRELPNTVSKAKTFEKVAGEVAQTFAGREEELKKAAQALGGGEIPYGSADLALRFSALPRVPLLLLYWRGEEEFPARSALLLDAGVLDYLDQEALVFLAEAFVKKLKGESLETVIP